jgi:S1-C subfamily serine protease
MPKDREMSYEIDSKRWMYVALILAIVVLGNSVVMFYMVFGPAPDTSELSEQIKNLETQIGSLDAQIRSLNTRLENRVYLNQSGNELLTRIYNLTRASVVLIQNRKQSSQGIVAQAIGSGFIYRVDDQAQYIVTNNHVVEGASELLVTLEGGDSTKATIVGRDPYSDLAVVKLSKSMPWLRPLALGNSSALQVGETVIAIGSPFGLSGTMTSGIVSQVGRDLDAAGGYKIVDVVQLDAAINPGNSGGPLVNLLGEVVGMNTAIISESGSSSGVGFAIPSDTITREAPILIAAGSYRHPYLGISGVDVNLDIAEAAKLNVTWGFLIGTVVTNSPAAQAGVRGGNRDVTVLEQTVRVGGDLLVGVDGLAVKRLNDLSVYMERNKQPGDKVTLTIIRGNQKLFLTVTLGVRP